ncbi:proline-rich transmembrane protein 1-like [Saccoglossus kowalevskii]|uniref:Proline-rich transmembrane protein 1-like n=1 Tax=Saccoglossus kowalevskii TaxID=10224 RepID=A0ABM0MAV2_SACKO|nr:PREDICTED: proline-rich transmembrane protein 1-like [Saccoglossus kowalevskii]
MSDKGDSLPHLTFPEQQQVLPPRGQVIHATTVRHVRIPEPPPNPHMCLSVLKCLFCCWPLGLVAIVKSFDVQSALAAGDIPRAEKSSKIAVKLNMAAIMFGMVIIVVNLILFLGGLPNQNQYGN